MTILVLLLVAMNFVMAAIIWTLRQDNMKKQALIAWCDEREKYFGVLLGSIRQLQLVQPKTNYVGHIDGRWESRFGPNGPRTFVPSTRGIEMINTAMDILQAGQVLRDHLMGDVARTLGALVEFERANPVPDYGVPQSPAPKDSTLRRPVTVDSHEKQDPISRKSLLSG